jgi:hypothetical protein
VGIEPTIPALEGAKTIHVLQRAATVISKLCKIMSSYTINVNINEVSTLLKQKAIKAHRGEEENKF